MTDIELLDTKIAYSDNSTNSTSGAIVELGNKNTVKSLPYFH